MTPTATTPATANGAARPPAASPVEYVRGLPPEDKEDLLVALLRDLIAHWGGRGLIPIETADGGWLGYYVPPEAAKARADRMGAEMPPEVRERFSQPVKDPDNCISSDEMLAIIRRTAGSSPG